MQSQIVTSFNALFAGLEPRGPILQNGVFQCGPDCEATLTATPLHIQEDTGKPLKACVTELRGDWKFLKETCQHEP